MWKNKLLQYVIKIQYTIQARLSEALVKNYLRVIESRQKCIFWVVELKCDPKHAPKSILEKCNPVMVV